MTATQTRTVTARQLSIRLVRTGAIHTLGADNDSHGHWWACEMYCDGILMTSATGHRTEADARADGEQWMADALTYGLPA